MGFDFFVIIKSVFLLSLVWAVSVAAQTIQDDLGNVLHTAPVAQRIVTLSPHTTEIIQFIGADDLLVAAADFSPNVPDSVPRISAFGGIDRELILQLAPDLVVAWASGNKPGDLVWLEKQGIRVYRSEPVHLSQLSESMRSIGMLVDRRNEAEQAALRFELALSQACQRERSREVYLSIWHKPAMTVGGSHWLNDVLHHAGMHNTYAAIQYGVFSVGRESLFTKQNLLHLSSYPLPDKNVMNRKIIDALSRPGPAIIQAIQHLCQ